MRKNKDGAYIDKSASIGSETIIERNTEVSKNATIGIRCKIHRNIFIGENVIIGDMVKIQDFTIIPSGVTLENGVFIGPCVTFTNDRYPRSITAKYKLKDSSDWILSSTLIKQGASIGANSTIICGITIGEWAMIGAGSIVTKNVPPHALVVGNPAKIAGWMSKSGFKMSLISKEKDYDIFYCSHEKEYYNIPNAPIY